LYGFSRTVGSNPTLSATNGTSMEQQGISGTGRGS
jgi:hypothetical protein